MPNPTPQKPRKFHKVAATELQQAVIKMCAEMGILPDDGSSYDILAAVKQEWLNACEYHQKMDQASHEEDRIAQSK